MLDFAGPPGFATAAAELGARYSKASLAELLTLAD